MRSFEKTVLFAALLLTGSFASAKTDKDWTEIRHVLADCIGIYSGVNNKVATSGMPDGPLLGNGKVGVVGASDENRARFYLTTSDFWNGAHLKAVPLPIGGVDISIDSRPGSGVQQEQHMMNAEILTKFHAGDVNIRTWVSATKDMLINELWTTGAEPVGIGVETWVHKTDTAVYPVSSGIFEDEIGWVSRETQSGKDIDWVCRAALATRITGADFSMILSGDNAVTAKASLQPKSKIYIVTAVRSGKNITDHITGSAGSVKDQNESTIEGLHDAHLNWWKKYWLKSYVRTYDPQIERYYFGALNESACAYREGCVCPGLFGPWVTTDKPNWSGNCTLSYNHQSTVVGFASSNRPELLRPYMQQRYDWAAEGRKRARRGDINFVTGNRWGAKFKHGIPGILDPITQGPWGSSASGDLYMGMLSGSVWAALPIIWYGNATQDQQYLSSIAYPYLKGVTDFWEAYLVKVDGKWRIKYTAAYEWASSDNNNTALDNAFVRELFKNMIQYSIDLNADGGKRKIWRDIVDNMEDLPTGNWNGQDVFKLSNEEMIKEGSWPGLAFLAGHTSSVSMSSNNDIKNRFISTLDAYNSWETSPNAPGFLWVSAVKGGYPAESLLNRFKDLLTQNMRRNFTVPKGGHGTESVANLEYINAAMLQSQEGFLRLFPGWPNQRAKFVRLRAQGAFLVSGELVDGEVSYVEIHSEKGRDCSVLNPWPGRSVTIMNSNKQPVKHSNSGDRIDFSTKPGSSYIIKNSGIPMPRSSNSEDHSIIRIGGQIWATGNLDVSTFRNGDPIPQMKTHEEWVEAAENKIPAWCYYNNDPAAGSVHGKLYNGFAVTDPRGLAPEGFHVATESDWLQLASFLGGRDTAGKEMKDEKTFKALMGGYRNGDGNFYGMGVNGYWWSSTVIFWDVMWNVVLNHKNSVFFRNYSKKPDGLYVRCVRDR